MSKEDVQQLPPVPKKRRAVEQALDLHIAMWLASDTLTPSERRRLEEEKQRRRAAQPDRPVGLLVGPEGATPAQLQALSGVLNGATIIHHPGVSKSVHSACKNVAPVQVHRDDVRAVIKASERVVALVKAPSVQAYSSGGVWQAIGLARHRNIAVTVIGPDGNPLQED